MRRAGTNKLQQRRQLKARPWWGSPEAEGGAGHGGRGRDCRLPMG